MTPTTYRFGRFHLQPQTRQLLVDGQPARLGARAFDLLLALVERRERMVPRGELFQLVWPGRVVEDQNLKVQVVALRKLCLLYTSPSPRDRTRPRMPSSA